MDVGIDTLAHCIKKRKHVLVHVQVNSLSGVLQKIKKGIVEILVNATDVHQANMEDCTFIIQDCHKTDKCIQPTHNLRL